MLTLCINILLAFFGSPAPQVQALNQCVDIALHGSVLTHDGKPGDEGVSVVFVPF
jgi:hypothetical protein